MVSFSCEVCNDTLVKKKLTGHFSRCPQAYFTCIDCNTTFKGREFEKHTQCITEDQKYQGKLYQPKMQKRPGPEQAKQEPKKAKANANAKAAEQCAAKPKSIESEPKSTAGSSQSKTPATGTNVEVKKAGSLKSVLKSLQKNYKIDKKEIYEKLTVTASGQLQWA